jgi:hypothetical protein
MPMMRSDKRTTTIVFSTSFSPGVITCGEKVTSYRYYARSILPISVEKGDCLRRIGGLAPKDLAARQEKDSQKDTLRNEIIGPKEKTQGRLLARLQGKSMYHRKIKARGGDFGLVS